MKKTASYLYLALVFLFLYAPILLMIALSFNDARHGISVWQGFTLENYAGLLKNEELMDALINSLVIALLSAVGACLLGTLGALGLNNVKKGRGVLMNFSNLPIINPEIVTGVSLMLLFIAVFGMKLGFFTVLLSHIVFNTPYVILNVMPRLRRMDKNLFEAALDLGCPPAKAFFKVVLPEIFPGVFAGFLISLTYSFDDFIISYFTGGNFQTLSVFVNNSMKKVHAHRLFDKSESLRYRCSVSAEWTEPQKLRIRVWAEDIYVGNMTMVFAFREDGMIALKADKNAQFFFDDFSGVAYGRSK